MGEVFQKHHPTVINHHAAKKSVPYSVENPTYNLKINLMGLLNLITLTKQFPIQSFIYVSSGRLSRKK
ncbi:NAD-dependent epimerase/dehydratase family protein [Bacillus sp. FSL M7-0996]|uniref:polysaccharide biosynthesis protein n=1 Tax=Bacillus sp. FSL M7-0996 TaxID=2921538 RepID=UPI0030FCB6DD